MVNVDSPPALVLYKLTSPRPASDQIARGHLFAQLDAGADRDAERGQTADAPMLKEVRSAI